MSSKDNTQHGAGAACLLHIWYIPNAVVSTSSHPQRRCGCYAVSGPLMQLVSGGHSPLGPKSISFEPRLRQLS